MLAVDKYNFENYVLPELQNSQITLVDDQIIFWFATYFAVYHFQMPISMLQNFDSTHTYNSRMLTVQILRLFIKILNYFLSLFL
jgi:hypothetical protein